MNIGTRSGRRGITSLLLVAWCLVLSACAPLLGYPKDPEDTDATLSALAPYFNGAKDVEYAHAPPAAKTNIRNEIIFARMRAYDITFADFEKRLYGDGNAVTLGSDLAGLILAGLTATTGNAATKSVLGAASAGVIGAKAAIDKDLYYQKTIPALLAQMEADRLQAKAPIVTGMKVPDEQYPLVQAYIDLDAYKNAGSIPRDQRGQQGRRKCEGRRAGHASNRRFCGGYIRAAIARLSLAVRRRQASRQGTPNEPAAMDERKFADWCAR